ncbi:MAG: hypothetical protein FWE47_01870 [Oscillospiraceae bacterium]|nr:hypothetical protein [Oscillospiraceae bacterium]
MSRKAEYAKNNRKQDLANEKLLSLLALGEKYLNNQRKEFADNPDMMFKLDYHMPTVTKCAKKIYSDDLIIYIASVLHDIGRGEELKRTGGFSGQGADDHHKIGVTILDKMWREVGGDFLSLEYQQIRNATEFHGMIDLQVNGETVQPPELAFATQDEMEKYRAVTLLDNIANGGMAYEYLRREQQTHFKSEDKGGFIPRENQWSKKVSPSSLISFKEGVYFNRNIQCKTYADYFLFAGFLAMRNLKSENLKVVEAQLEVLELPAMEVCYLNGKGLPAKENELFYKRNAAGEIVIANKLGQVKHKNGLEAYRKIFEDYLEPQIAKEAMQAFEKTILQARNRIHEKTIAKDRNLQKSMRQTPSL